MQIVKFLSLLAFLFVSFLILSSTKNLSLAASASNDLSKYQENSLLGKILGNPFSIHIVGTSQGQQDTAFNIIAEQMIVLLIAVIGILFFLMFIVGGIQYITSAGNEERAKSGKRTLTYAIGGLVLATISGTVIRTIAELSKTAAKEKTIADAINSIANFLLGGVALLTVLFIIIGGLQMIASRGNTEQTQKAKKTLTYAVIGLIVVILAKLIFVLINSTLVNFF
jgi:cytochrome bd-type quinol oxidase subunit 2